MLNKSKNTSSSSSFLYKEGILSYYILGSDFKDEIIGVLARAFTEEPTTSSLGKPILLDWIEFILFFIDECSTNGLSVFVRDETTQRIAGVFIARDINNVPQDFLNCYNSESTKTLTSMVSLLFKFDEDAIKQMPEIANGSSGHSVDLWMLGVHPDYKGKKIANGLMKAILPVVKNAGFKYATVEAMNYFTSKVTEFHEFKPVIKINTKEALWKGEKVFKNMVPPHGEWIYWVKNLKNEE